MEKEDYTKSILEYQEVKDTIEFEREYARAEGRAEGLAEGRSEGRAEGRAEGEAKAKLAMAKLLLEQGVDFEIITKTTGFTAEEIMEN